MISCQISITIIAIYQMLFIWLNSTYFLFQDWSQYFDLDQLPQKGKELWKDVLIHHKQSHLQLLSIFVQIFWKMLSIFVFFVLFFHLFLNIILLIYLLFASNLMIHMYSLDLDYELLSFLDYLQIYWFCCWEKKLWIEISFISSQKISSYFYTTLSTAESLSYLQAFRKYHLF